MRFLTRAWHAGELSDEDCDRVEDEYRAHQRLVRPKLPPRLRAYAESISIHDGRLRSVRLDRSTRDLRVALRAGDTPRGYFDLDLVYTGVSLDALDVTALALIARDPKAEALYDELDVTNEGLLQHRLLFWPYREVAITFLGFEFSQTPAPDRSFTRPREPFEETDAHAG